MQFVVQTIAVGLDSRFIHHKSDTAVRTMSILSRRLLFLLVSSTGCDLQLAHAFLTAAAAPPPLLPKAMTSSSTSTTALSLFTIYGHPGTRSPLINWACYELDVNFEMGSLAENPHPFGQVPCITDDNDVLVFESGAILQYLNQQYAVDSQQLSPAQRALVTSWITWANASLDPICFLETPQGKVYDTGLRQPNAKIDKLNELLGNDTNYLVPGAGGLTLADVAVASYLLYVVQFFPDAASFIAQAWPNVHRYMKECASREAYAQAFGASTASRLVELLSAATDQPSPKKLFGMF